MKTVGFVLRTGNEFYNRKAGLFKTEHPKAKNRKDRKSAKQELKRLY
jgi:hypothetical protein